MLTQSCKTATVAETASGPDTSASSAACLWARVLCGLAAIVDLFPALRTRLLSQLCNMPSVSNTDSNASDRDADAAAKGDTGGKMDSSKSSKSTDSGKGKNGDGQAGQRSKDKPRGGKRKGSGNGKNNAVNNSNADDATPKGSMMVLAGSLCAELGLFLLAGLGVQFSSSPRAKYGLPDMYRMLVAMCGGDKESSTAEGQYQESKGPGMVRLPSRSWLYKKLDEIREDYMLKRCQRMLRRSVVWAKRHGIGGGPIRARPIANTDILGLSGRNRQ